MDVGFNGEPLSGKFVFVNVPELKTEEVLDGVACDEVVGDVKFREMDGRERDEVATEVEFKKLDG